MKNCCNPVYNDIDGLTVREPEIEALVAAYFQLGRADFTDTDGRVYRFGSPEGDGAFYGWEIDPKTGEPLAEGTLLFTLHPERHGFERLLLPGLSESNMLSLFDFPACIRKQLQECVHAPRFFNQRYVNGFPKFVPMGALFVFAQPLIVFLSMSSLHRMIDNRVSVFQTNQVAQPGKRLFGAVEIPEFMISCKADRTENDMVMKMHSIGMCGNNVGVFSFCEAHGQFISQPVRFLGLYFAGFEGLPHVISRHVIPVQTAS